MPSNRKKARRAVRAFLKNLSGKDPDQQGVWACGAALYFEDLRTLLDSERAARRAAAVQSRKAAEAAQAAQRNQDAYLRERERTERGNVPLATQPDLRRLVEERGRKIRELTAERDRERENATRLAKELDTLRAAPGTVNYQKLYNELLPKAKRAERDLYNEQQRSARLQEALDSAAREAAPRTYADILREPDLRKIAEDLLPQFLETFLKGGKK